MITSIYIETIFSLDSQGGASKILKMTYIFNLFLLGLCPFFFFFWGVFFSALPPWRLIVSYAAGGCDTWMPRQKIPQNGTLTGQR